MFNVSFNFEDSTINFDYTGLVDDKFIIDITDIDNNLRIFDTYIDVSPNCGYWIKSNYPFNDTNILIHLWKVKRGSLTAPFNPRV